MSKYPDGHYVYRLLDPRTDLPFYVGKGQRARAWAHEAAVRSGNSSGNARKVAKIQEILLRGDSVQIEIVAVYESEADALDHEFRLVDLDPTLTNIAPGGIGRIVSPLAAERRAKARRLLLYRAKRRDFKEVAARERARRREKHLAMARTPRDRAQIAAWLDGMSEIEAQKYLTPSTSALIRQHEARLRASEPKARNRKAQLRRRMVHALSEMSQS